MFASIASRLTRRPLKLMLLIFILLTIATCALFLQFDSNQQFKLKGRPISSWLSKNNDADTHSEFFPWTTPSFCPPLPNPHLTSLTPLDLCATFPTHLLPTIQLVFKTGAGEHPRTDAHLSTVTSCFPNILIVSDYAETRNNRTYTDILADLPAAYAENNPDFAAYTAVKDARSRGEDVPYTREGWKLDRFKFLPMVERAYLVAPAEVRWFVFIEADVYFFWDTLFRLLSRLDWRDMHYLGAPVNGAENKRFAYGGAGIVLSRGLMDKFVGGRKVGSQGEYVEGDLSEGFMQWAKEDCCGDAVLGYAILNKTGVRIRPFWPVFNGDEMKSIFSDRRTWCIPLLAVHRVGPELMRDMWMWERTRPYTESPFVHSSFLSFTHPFLPAEPTRVFWDNMSNDLQPRGSPAHSSAAECASACKADAECLQYSYTPTQCKLDKAVRLGHGTDEKGPEFVSGWNVDNMKKLGFREGGSWFCEEERWPRPQ